MAPTDVDRLFEHYVSDYRTAGDADPAAYLEQLSGTDRDELLTLIDAFLARRPRRAYDPAAYRGSPAEAIVESLDASLRGQAGLWPAVLPQLRSRAQLKRSELVDQLAHALGVPEQREKVGAYYHEMEQGVLAPERVSDRVLDAIARIVDASAAGLRRAGAALTPAPSSPAAGAVFARSAPAPELSAPPAVGSSAPGQAWDEVDRLFLGGP